MNNFDQWYADLISDELWFALLRQYKDETIRKGAEKVYAQCVADPVLASRSVYENRKHVYNIVIKNNPDKIRKNWVVVPEEKKEDWKPVSPEEREKNLADFAKMLDSLPKGFVNNIAVDEENEGQVRVKHESLKRSEVENMEVYNSHKEKVALARRKYYLSAFPDASEEEIIEYINKMPL